MVENYIEQNNLLAVRQVQKHPFHVLQNSKLPFLIAAGAGLLALSIITKLHDLIEASADNCVIARLIAPFFTTPEILDYLSINVVILAAVILLILVIGSWASVLIHEASVEGQHTAKVQLALKWGVLLFLVSEAMLFFPFFWSFFHGSLAPSVAIGGVWPPVGIRGVEVLNPYLLPLVNTAVLLCSVVAVVSAHRAVLRGVKNVFVNAMYVAISYGVLFSWLQFMEYGLTLFTINDGLFGSAFFMLTGLHGFHVIVGTTLLLISYWRLLTNKKNVNYSCDQHVGFEAAAWYWHFVDVVWLGVFAFIYIWGI